MSEVYDLIDVTGERVATYGSISEAALMRRVSDSIEARPATERERAILSGQAIEGAKK